MSDAAAPPPTQLTIREVLKLKPVRRLWLAQIVSVFGDFLAIFAVLSYATFNLHATATQVTWISVSFMIPFAFVALMPVRSFSQRIGLVFGIACPGAGHHEVVLCQHCNARADDSLRLLSFA